MKMNQFLLILSIYFILVNLIFENECSPMFEQNYEMVTSKTFETTLKNFKLIDSEISIDKKNEQLIGISEIEQNFKNNSNDFKLNEWTKSEASIDQIDLEMKDKILERQEIQNDFYDENYFKIENTSMASVFDNFNFTLSSHSQFINASKQGELNDLFDITQFRRLPIDMITNEEIISIDDTNKLVDNDLNTNYEEFEKDILSAPVDDCGRNQLSNNYFNSPTDRRGKIIGGQNTKPGEIPWIVSVRLKHPDASIGQVGHWCTSVLINSQWVVTVAHCILNPLFHLPEPIHWELRLGKWNISQNESTQKTYKVTKLFNVKQYSGYDNDLALLKLDTKIESNLFQPICLPLNEHFDFSNAEHCFVYGWGKTDYSMKKRADILQKVKVNIYDNIDCQRVYYPQYRIMIKKWHLCAGDKFRSKGTCHGDSGAPLQCLIKNRWYLAGLTSFGSNCAKYGFPDVYTNIIYFSRWIREKIRNE